MTLSARSRPAELRLSIDALRSLPWAQAGHLAVVDAVEEGWDAGAAWIAAQVKISKRAALEAGEANLRAGVYDERRVEPKRMKTGREFNATLWRVARDWTTRRDRRADETLFVRLDTGFLDANPRASELTKRVYHFLAFEQWLWGASALTPAQIADELGVETSRSQTAARRVRRVRRELGKAGWIEQAEDHLTLPRYPHGAPRIEDARPDARRALHAAGERQRIAEEEGATRNRHRHDSEPPPTRFGTAQRLRTIKNDVRASRDASLRGSKRQRQPAPPAPSSVCEKSSATTRDQSCAPKTRRAPRQGFGRHELGPNYSNCYFDYATAEQRDDLLEFIGRLDAKYGTEEARGFARDACIARGPSAVAVTDHLGRRFAELDPRTARRALADDSLVTVDVHTLLVEGDREGCDERTILPVGS